MILCKQNNNWNRVFSAIKTEPYHIVNLCLAVIIALVFIYSGIFSPEKDNYPVACIHEKLTGEPCISCGLSHSFSLALRGKFSDATQWNPCGLRVFLFFISQFIFRINFLRLSLKNPETRRQLIIYDSCASALVFIISFWPFIAKIVDDFLHVI